MPIILNQDDETTLFFVEKREKSQGFPIIFELASLDFSHRACYNHNSFILCKSSMRTNRIFPPHDAERAAPEPRVLQAAYRARRPYHRRVQRRTSAGYARYSIASGAAF